MVLHLQFTSFGIWCHCPLLDRRREFSALSCWRSLDGIVVHGSVQHLEGLLFSKKQFMFQVKSASDIEEGVERIFTAVKSVLVIDSYYAFGLWGIVANVSGVSF